MEKTFKAVIHDEHTFTGENLNDIIETALEGAINYWCGKVRIKQNKNNRKYQGISNENQCKVTLASDVIGYGGTLILTDDESKQEFELNASKLIKGIEEYCTINEERLSWFMTILDDNVADNVVQYAIFNRINYL
jgi:hypothetical protein